MSQPTAYNYEGLATIPADLRDRIRQGASVTEAEARRVLAAVTSPEMASAYSPALAVDLARQIVRSAPSPNGIVPRGDVPRDIENLHVRERSVAAPGDTGVAAGVFVVSFLVVGGALWLAGRKAPRRAHA